MPFNPFYKIEFHALASDSLNPDFRDEETLLLAKAAIRATEATYDTFFHRVNEDGTLIPIWEVGIWYESDQVIYYPTGEIYICVVNQTLTEPSTSSDWRKVSDLFIGGEYTKYCDGSRIQLEWLLNTRFFTAFSPLTATSVIWIETLFVSLPAFVVGSVEIGSSIVGTIDSDGFVGDSYTFDFQPNFRINFPAYEYSLLGTEPEKAIRNFVDRFVAVGFNYEIVTY